VDYRFGEPLYIEGGDPFDYSTGREIDGIPVSEAEFQRRVGNGDAVGDVFRGGRYAGSLNLAKDIIFSRLRIIFDVFRPPEGTDTNNMKVLSDYYIRSFTMDVEINSGEQRRSAQRKRVPSVPARVPFPGLDAIKKRLEGDCNAFIARLLAKATEKYGTQGNSAVARDGFDLLEMIGSKGFVMRDSVKVNGYPVSGSVEGSILGNNTFPAGTATVLIANRFMFGNNATTIASWQDDYIFTAIHEMLHLAARYSGYNDIQLATAASELPGASPNLPAPPKDDKDTEGILRNSGYYDNELKKYCGPK
jgi:hypothetical protein